MPCSVIDSEYADTKDHSLQEVLNDENLRELLLAEMKRNFCEESLLFWCDVEEFRSVAADGPKELEERAKQIFFQYCKPGATFEINVEAHLRKSVGFKLEQPDATMFDELQMVVFDLIRMQDYKKFIQSTEYKQVG